MMKRFLKYFLFLFSLYFGVSWGEVFAQNLVSNSSFEDTLSCPTAMGQIDRARGWSSPTYIGTSDYYNSCASFPVGLNNNQGYQNPKTGNGYAGLYTYYYNHIQMEFICIKYL